MSPKINQKSKPEKDKLQKTSDEAQPQSSGSKDARLQSLRGMRDVLPEEMRYWDAIFKVAAEVAREYRYERLITPVLEPTSLFAHSVGEATDIVEKEMYTFQDRSEESVTLRPEFTASFARACIEHGMHNRPQPVRVWDMGACFRYDRPQAGRYRQFWQADFEVVGDAHAVVDAQLIAAAYALGQKLGLPTLIQVNSIGDKSCRPNFIRVFIEYIRGRKETLCEDCQRRLERNPMRILDCKQASCQQVLQGAPQIVDWLCNACREHFIKVLEYLDELEIPYCLEPTLVRGLDYYTRTTFEMVYQDTPRGEEEGGSEDALVVAGGGRYDDLFAELGGRATPAAGFAVGIERLILAMQRTGVTPEAAAPPQIFIAQLGNDARKKCLKLFADLRMRGFTVAEQFSKDGLSAQLEVAARLGCRVTLILGQKELMDNTIIIRDMESGIQEIVDFARAVPELEKRIARADTRGPLAAPMDPAATLLEGSHHQIDLKREEYLLKETPGESDEGATTEAEVEIEETVVEAGVSEEEWEKDDGPKEKQGLSWASKDYADDQFDE